MDEALASFRAGFARSAFCSAERLEHSLLSLSKGTSWRSLLGLEKENAVFERYRVIRQAERSYL